MDDNQANKCNYKVNAPYPPVRVAGPNPLYACEMLGNIADVVSEMSDVTRYFYIAVVTKPHYSWISKCFHDISIVEMRHLNIFAELALLLGADPRLWSCRDYNRWWSPSFIGYPPELGALIAESIKAEEAAISKYSRQANTICDLNIVAILHRIIRDEEHHLQIFNKMYGRI
ncbi:ferritin family protein [Desulfosporosinus sp. PR]|uniref:ferritin-like domain-containing protein n=1 Tax=Candidatus Desulfosporosinus nitrosoreducens TaxID=3401928 RepID=UPI0027ED3357|nr:ferritin family protein [Desulfosporosinus sp. PR]MDQ7095692.1 ferritin family protein [Desulfosporosinus sp. PR]